MRTLIDPRLRASLQDDFPSRCTIQNVVHVVSMANQEVPDPASATDVAGLVNIQCRIAPLIEQRPTDNENLPSDIQELYVQRQCKLNGYFPSITPRSMQAIVDGVAYIIRGVEHDGARFSTRLRLEISTP